MRLFWTLPSTVPPYVELLDLDMTGPTNKTFVPNFAFLTQHNEVLVHHAALAERYVLMTQTRLCSSSVSLVSFWPSTQNTGVAVEEHESQRELIDKLYDRQVINAQVSQLFHGLRKSGNEAAHQHTGDRREALHQLQICGSSPCGFTNPSAVIRTLRQGLSSRLGSS